MLILKIMSGEDKADSNTSKCFRFVNIGDRNFAFIRKDGKPLFVFCELNGDVYEGDEIELQGNAYVMQDGKTIASFAYSDIQD